MLSAVSLAQPFARPGTPSFNRQHATNPSTCQLANIPRKTTVNIMPLQLQQLQQMGAAAMSHQLSPTSVKFPPRQLHQTVEESSQEVSPDQMEDKTTRKGSKGKVLYRGKTGFNINTFYIIINSETNFFHCTF